jgi:hypothetical protein
VGAWPYWYRDVLKGLSAPDTAKNELFLNVWHTYEESSCSYNPLNTTQRETGSTTCNSAGVQSYPTPAVGTKATVATLENGRYPDIVAALRSGNPFTYAKAQAVAAEIRTWRTANFATWYLTQGPTAQTGPLTQSPPPLGTTHQVTDAWAALMREMGKHTPGRLASAKRARERMLRKVR